jgi:hypothetical protein
MPQEEDGFRKINCEYFSVSSRRTVVGEGDCFRYVYLGTRVKGIGDFTIHC